MVFADLEILIVHLIYKESYFKTVCIFSMQLFPSGGICLFVSTNQKESFLKKVSISKPSLAFEMHVVF